MQYSRETEDEDGITVREGESICAMLVALGEAGDAEALLLPCEAAPFLAGDHAGQQVAVREVQNRGEELWRVGEEDIPKETFQSRVRYPRGYYSLCV